jgi:ribosomal protein S3
MRRGKHSGVRIAHCVAQLKSGIIGIKVKIMPPDVVIPDKVTVKTGEEEEQPSAASAMHAIIRRRMNLNHQRNPARRQSPPRRNHAQESQLAKRAR